MRLEEELRLEKLELAKKSAPIVDPEATLKEYRIQMELESIQDGFKSLKDRESTIDSREQELIKSLETLRTERAEFDTAQAKRMEAYNENIKKYNLNWDLLQVKHKESDERMRKTLEEKTQAESIIKNQTEAQKVQQEKSKAYEDNMGEALDVVFEISKVLKRQGEQKCVSMSRTLAYDLALISRMQDMKAGNTSIADVISVDCSRLTELCEYIQDSKNSNGKVLTYLLGNIQWIEDNLKIEWTPNEQESYKS